jgi:hypothetical protein
MSSVTSSYTLEEGREIALKEEAQRMFGDRSVAQLSSEIKDMKAQMKRASPENKAAIAPLLYQAEYILGQKNNNTLSKGAQPSNSKPLTDFLAKETKAAYTLRSMTGAAAPQDVVPYDAGGKLSPALTQVAKGKEIEANLEGVKEVFGPIMPTNKQAGFAVYEQMTPIGKRIYDFINTNNRSAKTEKQLTDLIEQYKKQKKGDAPQYEAETLKSILLKRWSIE